MSSPSKNEVILCRLKRAAIVIKITLKQADISQTAYNASFRSIERNLKRYVSTQNNSKPIGIEMVAIYSIFFLIFSVESAGKRQSQVSIFRFVASGFIVTLISIFWFLNNNKYWSCLKDIHFITKLATSYSSEIFFPNSFLLTIVK